MTTSRTDADHLLPDDRPRPGRIVRVDDSLRSEAVLRLVAIGSSTDEEHARRFLRFSRDNGIDLQAMWARLDEGGAVRQTVLAVPNAGRTAMLFATALQRDAEVASMAGLVDHACAELAHDPTLSGAAQLVQVLLDPSDRRQIRPFLEAGLSELARLSYLERSLPGPRSAGAVDWPPDITVTPYDASRRDELLRILDDSYEQTLDCPGLRGLRCTEDILGGHLATGEFDPDLWTLMHIDGRPAGAVLLNPSSQGRCVELVYLGLALFARGRGLGRLLLRHGLHGLRGRRERTVTLAVDEDNAPALGLYRAEGFKRVLRRVALIRSIAPVGDR